MYLRISCVSKIDFFYVKYFQQVCPPSLSSSTLICSPRSVRFSASPIGTSSARKSSRIGRTASRKMSSRNSTRVTVWLSFSSIPRDSTFLAPTATTTVCATTGCAGLTLGRSESRSNLSRTKIFVHTRTPRCGTTSSTRGLVRRFMAATPWTSIRVILTSSRSNSSAPLCA